MQRNAGTEAVETGLAPQCEQRITKEGAKGAMPSTMERRYVKIKCILKTGGRFLRYEAIDIKEGRECVWNTVETQSEAEAEELEGALERLKKNSCKSVGGVYMHFQEKQKVHFVTENIAKNRSIAYFVKELGSIPILLIRRWAMDVLAGAECLGADNVDFHAGRVFIDTSGGIGRAKLEGAWGSCMEAKKTGSAGLGEEGAQQNKAVHSFGILLLAMATGDFSCGDKTYLQTEKGEPLSEAHLQRTLPGRVVSIVNACLRDLVVSCLRPTAQIVMREIPLHHFFEEEASEKAFASEPCLCVQNMEELSDQSLVDEDFENALLSLEKKKAEESIYDKEKGVEVKARSVSDDVFSFQMHFFKTRKSIAFYFNEREDTVDSVMKEMEDEGLAEEKQVDAIKKHMERLIVMIKNTSEEESGKREDEYVHANGRGECGEGGKGAEASQRTPALSPAGSEEEKSSDAGRAESAEGEGHAREASEENIDYPFHEYRNSVGSEEFVMDVAAATKRVRSTAENWHGVLVRQDIQTVGELRLLVEEDWESLGLPVFASRAMKNMLYGKGNTPFKEKMQVEDEQMKEHKDSDSIEELLAEVAETCSRSKDTALEWLGKIRGHDVRTVGELKLLHECDWKMLGLSVFACRVVRNAIFRRSKFGRLAIKTSPRAEGQAPSQK